jgi:hypothetical protein
MRICMRGCIISYFPAVAPRQALALPSTPGAATLPPAEAARRGTFVIIPPHSRLYGESI